MYSLEVINQMNEERGREAEELEKQPQVMPNDRAVEIDDFRSIPNLGDHVPEGWEEAGKDFFVDSSGFGAPGEPALTINQFALELTEYVQDNPDHGFGITSCGQFQIYITAFKPVS